jgi:hypothetical protein
VAINVPKIGPTAGLQDRRAPAFVLAKIGDRMDEVLTVEVEQRGGFGHGVRSK